MTEANDVCMLFDHLVQHLSAHSNSAYVILGSNGKVVCKSVSWSVVPENVREPALTDASTAILSGQVSIKKPVRSRSKDGWQITQHCLLWAVDQIGGLVMYLTPSNVQDHQQIVREETRPQVLEENQGSQR